MQADGQCTMCSAPNAITRRSQRLRIMVFRKSLTHCMIFTAVVGSALASITINEPQEELLHSSQLPAQVSGADNIVHTAHPTIGIAPVRPLDSAQLPMCRPFRYQEGEGCLGSFRLAESSEWALSFADGKEKSQAGTLLSTHWAETPAGL